MRESCICGHDRLNHYVPIKGDDGTVYRGGCELCDDCIGYKEVKHDPVE